MPLTNTEHTTKLLNYIEEYTAIDVYVWDTFDQCCIQEKHMSIARLGYETEHTDITVTAADSLYYDRNFWRGDNEIIIFTN